MIVRGQIIDANTVVMTDAGNYTIVNEAVLIVNKTVGAATTVTLPPVAYTPAGRTIEIKDGKGDAATNNITVDANASETIDGSTTSVIALNYGSLTVVCNGTQWNVVPNTQSSGNMTAINYDAGASGIAGTVDIFPSTASKGKNAFTATDNAGNTTNTITNAAQAGARTFTIPDPGASAKFDMSAVEAEASNGAIGIKQGLAALTKAGVAAMTLAAPTTTTDDGKVLRIVAMTANAHTVTQASPGFNNAGAGGDVATFGGAVGDNLVLIAYQGVWYVQSQVNVTIA